MGEKRDWWSLGSRSSCSCRSRVSCSSGHTALEVAAAASPLQPDRDHILRLPWTPAPQPLSCPSSRRPRSPPSLLFAPARKQSPEDRNKSVTSYQGPQYWADLPVQGGEPLGGRSPRQGLCEGHAGGTREWDRRLGTQINSTHGLGCGRSPGRCPLRN